MRILYICVVIAFFSCSKEAFLSEKPDKSDVVPTTLAELQAVLDQDRDMNGMGTSGRGPVPNLGEIGADSYYVTDQTFNSVLAKQMQNYYSWSTEPYEGMEEYSWRWPYLSVFYANVVLDKLKATDVSISHTDEYNYLYGSALFYRAHAYYQLAQVFAPPYEAEKAGTLPGIPLRESADFNTPNKWVSLEEVYTVIIDDLKRSVELMGSQVRFPKTRPSGHAALGLLARVYLTMQDFAQARIFAESALGVGDELLDYNTLNTGLSYTFSTVHLKNPEIIFACNMVGSRGSSYPTRDFFALVQPDLLTLYKPGDLRRDAFFKNNSNGTVSYKGSYNGDDYFFTGVATSELYLILAECYARGGLLDESIDLLNRLLEKRWNKTDAFVPLKVATAEEALEMVFEERRKELVFRGLRWTDIRRLNIEGAGIVQSRTINGTKIEILPNDARYVWPLPPEVRAFNSP
ncbi:RagB/SusD family nutrient uptake outer membrane protein [Sphingobacterium pedocola]|uniref:RagB/SusD family nutrient uptake outer membrane protein n=1 Tax=Sphingobacterium pedocola TaxID=2082722 RepID=A0ABR9T2U7_9SPHI|nr:RagB/SusD family nutrient uptake outer membrane protein [Sphingobacterium pedocola]MBE8719660.1 hypothetical protein [Sphingobacterium pedocola]